MPSANSDAQLTDARARFRGQAFSCTPSDPRKLVYNFLAKLVGERIQCVLISAHPTEPLALRLLAWPFPDLRHPDVAGVLTEVEDELVACDRDLWRA